MVVFSNRPAADELTNDEAKPVSVIDARLTEPPTARFWVMELASVKVVPLKVKLLFEPFALV